MGIENRESKINIYNEESGDGKNICEGKKGEEVENNRTSEEQYKINQKVIEKHLDFLLNDLSNDNSDKVVEELISKLEEKINKEEEDLLSKRDCEKIIQELKDLGETEHDYSYVLDKIKEIFKPFIELYAEDYHKREEEWAEDFNEKEGFKSLNRVLSYGGSSEVIHLHHPPARTIPKPERLNLYLEGMQELASIVNDNPRIKEITVSGPLVIRMKELLQSVGFEIKKMEETLREKHFPNEEETSVKTARMSRDKFLETFLDKISEK